VNGRPAGDPEPSAKRTDPRSRDRSSATLIAVAAVAMLVLALAAGSFNRPLSSSPHVDIISPPIELPFSGRIMEIVVRSAVLSALGGCYLFGLTWAKRNDVSVKVMLTVGVACHLAMLVLPLLLAGEDVWLFRSTVESQVTTT
jgi:hypothetical protein